MFFLWRSLITVCYVFFLYLGGFAEVGRQSSACRIISQMRTKYLGEIFQMVVERWEACEAALC